MFAGIYRDFAGKSECGDFKFTGIACIPAIPVIFEVNQKKVWTFYIYSLLRFFKFPYNFCGDFRRTCNPRDNYMHFTGYVLRHGDPPHFLWGKNLQCTSSLLCAAEMIKCTSTRKFWLTRNWSCLRLMQKISHGRASNIFYNRSV